MNQDHYDVLRAAFEQLNLDRSRSGEWTAGYQISHPDNWFARKEYIRLCTNLYRKARNYFDDTDVICDDFRGLFFEDKLRVIEQVLKDLYGVNPVKIVSDEQWKLELRTIR